MRELYLPPLLLLLLPIGLSAQASLRVSAFTGPAWVIDERHDDDGNGWSQGLGLTLGYEVGGRWGTLLLSVSRESFSGFDVTRDFSQFVTTFDRPKEKTSVSLAIHQRGFQAYRFIVGGENSFGSDFLPRLQWGGGIGVIMVSGRDRINYEVIEQDLEGNYLPLSDRYGFLVEGGIIRRVPQADMDSRYPSQLKRFNLSLQTFMKYSLTDDVQLALSWDCAISPLGKPYGNLDRQSMFGELNYLQIGLVGRVFNW